jgi:hypothetical protein
MPPNGASGLWQQNGAGLEGNAASWIGESFNPGYAAGGDGFRPDWWNGGNSAASPYTSLPGLGQGGPAGILSQIMSLLQQIVGSLGGGSTLGGTAGAAPGFPGEAQGPTATFSNVALSSTGDPHLAVTGTEQNANGTTTNVNDHYDSMTCHKDLFSTNDFGDHFRVSTTATTPNANGVTMNATATASMDHGRSSVTMGQNGAVTVVNDGQATTLGAGQTMTLAGGEVVSENASGGVSIAQQNANGESMTTTFAWNGSGVDVTANASGGVTLGGDLIKHATS